MINAFKYETDLAYNPVIYYVTSLSVYLDVMYLWGDMNKFR